MRSQLPHRKDDNQKEIEQALLQIGASVQSLHMVGSGCPDLLVGYRGVNFLLEVKDGRKSPSARKLTDDEQAWHETWRGVVYIVYNAIDAVNLVTHMTLAYDTESLLPFGEMR